jgi:hypothetical protein
VNNPGDFDEASAFMTADDFGVLCNDAVTA